MSVNDWHQRPPPMVFVYEEPPIRPLGQVMIVDKKLADRIAAIEAKLAEILVLIEAMK